MWKISWHCPFDCTVSEGREYMYSRTMFLIQLWPFVSFMAFRCCIALCSAHLRVDNIYIFMILSLCFNAVFVFQSEQEEVWKSLIYCKTQFCGAGGLDSIGNWFYTLQIRCGLHKKQWPYSICCKLDLCILVLNYVKETVLWHLNMLSAGWRIVRVSRLRFWKKSSRVMYMTQM